MMISSVTTAETDAMDKPLVTLLTCYMTGSTEGRNLGTAGYSHDFVAKLYAPILEQWGEVIAVANPQDELDLAVEKVLAEGKQPVHVSILPLQDMTIAKKAPNVAVPAWEFPDVPNEDFGDNTQSNWPRVANACDLVLVSGPFTVRSLRKGGAVSPMRIVPVPTPDAYFDIPSWRPHQTKIVHCRGYVFPQQRPPVTPPPPAPLPSPPLPVARTPEPEPVPPSPEPVPPPVVECAPPPAPEPTPPPVVESIAPAVAAPVPPPAVQPSPRRRGLIRKAGRAIEWSVRKGALYVMGRKGYDDFARIVWGRKPKVQPAPEPILSPTPELIPEPVQEVIAAPAPDPVPPSAPEPIQETVPTSVPEPVQESVPEPSAPEPPAPPIVSVVNSVLNSPEARQVAVNDLYRRYLRRPADSGGLNHWANLVAGGATYQQVAGCLFGSAEYFQMHGATNESFLKALYLDVLGREIEAAEQTHFAARLNGGPETPLPPNETRLPYDSVSQIELSGVVFTSIFNPDDGRKNWYDLLTAGLLALADREDATIVFKLISSNPASIERVIKWYLDRGIKHKCKVVFIGDFLSESQMCELAEASTFYVQATKAEGNCLPLMNYLAAGRPGVSPNHSSMGDYFGEESGFVVESHPEPAAWPHDPRVHLRTTWGRIVWTSLRDQIAAAYRLAAEDTGGYLRLSLRCRRKMKAWASIPAVAARLLGAIGELLAGQLTKRPDDAETLAAIQVPTASAEASDKPARIAGLRHQAQA